MSQHQNQIHVFAFDRLLNGIDRIAVFDPFVYHQPFRFFGLNQPIQFGARFGNHGFIFIVQGRDRKIPAVDAERIVNDMQDVESGVEFTGQGDS